MLDIVQVSDGDKHYSAKVDVNMTPDNNAKVKIIYIKEVSPITATSYGVIRDIYSIDYGTAFSKTRFHSIFVKIMTEVAKKYKTSNIIYRDK